MSQVTLRRSGKRQFVGIDERKQTLVIDAGPAGGGEFAGLKPSELLPFAVASCVAVTAVGILEKMRQEPEAMSVSVEFEHEADFPKPFKYFKLNWQFRGTDLDPEKLQKAVHMSEKQYCSVSSSLKESILIEHRIIIEP